MKIGEQILIELVVKLVNNHYGNDVHTRMSSSGDTIKKSTEADACTQNIAESQKPDKMNKSGESQGACYWYVYNCTFNFVYYFTHFAKSSKAAVLALNQVLRFRTCRNKNTQHN